MKLRDILPLIRYCDVMLFDVHSSLINRTHCTVAKNTAAAYLDSTVLFIEPGVAEIEIYLDVEIVGNISMIDNKGGIS